MNARIRENSEVTTRLMTPDAAVELGAMALFGEKYGDEVRVVAMGEPEGNKPAWSIELCGGTHVRRTGDIGYFRDRRRNRGRGRRAPHRGGDRCRRPRPWWPRPQRRLNEAAGALRAAPAEVPDADRRRCWRTAASWNARWPSCRRSWPPAAGRRRSRTVGGVKFAARNLGEVPARELKGLADAIGKQLGSGVVALVSTAEGKASIVVGVSADLTGRISAVDLVRAASAAVGGKGGGGRPDMAQAGGPDGARADEALAAVRAALAG